MAEFNSVLTAADDFTTQPIILTLDWVKHSPTSPSGEPAYVVSERIGNEEPVVNGEFICTAKGKERAARWLVSRWTLRETAAEHALERWKAKQREKRA